MEKLKFIRRMSADDFSAVSEIYNLTHIYEYAGEDFNFSAQSLEENKLLLELFNNSEVFVFDNKKVKGFIGHQGKNIIWLYVHPEYQGLGIGGQLIKFLLNKLNNIAVLSVVKTNSVALDLYQKYGFRVHGGGCFDYQGKSVDVLVLVKGF